MKTTRRGFFAAMLAPLLGRLMPKLPVVPKFRQLGLTSTAASLNGFQEALNDGVGWSGDVYPTYGSVARNELAFRAINRGIAQEIETRMIRARYELHAAIFEDEDLEG